MCSSTKRIPHCGYSCCKDTFGSDAGGGMTGTEEELNEALAKAQTNEGVRDLGIYFGRADPTDPRVKELRKRLDAQHIGYEDFIEPIEFERRVRYKVADFIWKYAAASTGRTRPTRCGSARSRRSKLRQERANCSSSWCRR